MTPPTEADIEILVCTPASSRASRGPSRGASERGDRRFRKLARAYASFARHPVTKINITSTPLQGQGQEQDGPNTSLPTTSVASEAHQQPDTTAPPPGSGLSMKFWSLSFDSVWDNVQSPRVGHAVKGSSPIARQPGSASTEHGILVCEPQPRIEPKRQNYVSPDEYIPDSQPEPPEPAAAPRARRRRLTLDDDIEVASDADETRILESQDLDAEYGWAFVDDIEDVDDGDIPKRGAWAGSPDLSAMPIMEPEPIEDGTQEPALLLGPPQRPPARQPLSQRSANSQQSSQNSQGLLQDERDDRYSRDGHIPSSLPEDDKKMPVTVAGGPCKALESSGRLTSASASASASASMPGRLHKRRRTDDQYQYQHQLIDDIEDADQTELDSSFARPAELAYSRRDKNLYIMSPEPPLGCGCLDPASLITERLAKLAQDLDLEHRFTKVAVREREAGRPSLGPFDRGYWALDTAGWPPGLRQRAWEFLAKYVSRGDAGWGVWCSRGSHDDHLLKLHCFATTAGHTYLLLYLASQRQVLTTGAVWLDGSLSPAILIPPRKRKEDGHGCSSRPSSRSNSRPNSRIGGGAGSSRPGTATATIT